MNVPKDFPIFSAVSCMGFQSIPSKEFFNFVPTIDPISVKSAFFHASFTFFAKSDTFLSMDDVSNISDGDGPVYLSDPES